MQFFNFSQDKMFLGIKLILDNIVKIENDGRYILPREVFKNEFTIYSLQDEIN